MRVLGAQQDSLGVRAVFVGAKVKNGLFNCKQGFWTLPADHYRAVGHGDESAFYGHPAEGEGGVGCHLLGDFAGRID
ncbi:hypothetical protein KDK82_5958 [Delftia sp. K82]|jgi:hypothetical protein|nr:hypothetical protein KDK82_5958 [Delftia sp. K82]